MSFGDEPPLLEGSAVRVRHFLVPNSDLGHAVVIRLLTSQKQTTWGGGRGRDVLSMATSLASQQ